MTIGATSPCGEKRRVLGIGPAAAAEVVQQITHASLPFAAAVATTWLAVAISCDVVYGELLCPPQSPITRCVSGLDEDDACAIAGAKSTQSSGKRRVMFV